MEQHLLQQQSVSLVELFKGPTNRQGQFELNVILIPEIQSSVGLDWAADGGEPWPGDFFGSLTNHLRIFEFNFNISLKSNFSWTSYLDLGRVLADCIVSSSSALQIDKCALMLAGHGLGGLLVKQAAVIFEEQDYNPKLRALNEVLSTIILIGTPHPKHDKSSENQIDGLLASIQTLNKRRLEKIGEDFAVCRTLSAKFSQLSSDRPIWSLYEGKPTKYSQQGLFRTKTEMIVDSVLATTSLETERLIKIDADHRNICKLKPDMPVLQNILKTLRTMLHPADGLSVLRNPDPHMNLKAVKHFGSVTTENHEPLSDSDQVARNSSPAMATAGSKDITTFDVVLDPNSASGPVSYLPAVKLPCYMLGPPAAECFGRVKIFELLDFNLLPSSKTTTTTSLTSVFLRSFAVCGPGGVGKTTIAREFASKNRDKFDAIFWVSSDTEGKLSTSFNQIAAELGLLDPADFGNSVISRNRVLNWLSNPLKHSRGTEDAETIPSDLDTLANWLIVFDNADNLELLTEYWPIAGTGSVLLTSRDPLAKKHMYSGSGVDLEGFDSENAASFLQHRLEANGSIDKEDAIRLASTVQGLPVLLTVIASMIQQSSLSVPEFLQYYEEPEFKREIYNFQIDNYNHNERKNSFHIWSFDDFDEEALALLEILSLLDPDCISEAMLAPLDDTIELPVKYPRTEKAYEKARGNLLKNSLIARDMDKKELTIHRVIQDAIRARMSKTTLKNSVQGVVNLLTAAWSPTNDRWDFVMDRWAQCSKIFPHIENFQREYLKLPEEQFGRDEKLKVAVLLIEAGWFHFERGNIDEIIGFIDPVFKLIEEDDSERKKTLSDAHYCLSQAYTWLREPEKNKYHAHKCFDLRKELSVTGIDLALGIATCEIAFYHFSKRELEEGLKYSKDCTRIFEALESGEGDAHEIKIGTYIGTWGRCSSALALFLLGRLDEAEETIMTLYTRHEKWYGLMNLRIFKTGVSMGALGQIKGLQGHTDESFDLAKKTLQQYKQTIGDNHYYTAGALVKVADHLTRSGEAKQAGQYLEEASRIFEYCACFAPDLARVFQKLSFVHNQLGNPLKARGLQLKAQSLLRNFAREKNITISPHFTDEDYNKAVAFLLV